MKNYSDIELRHYFQSALLYNIPKNLKRFSFEQKDQKLKIIAIFEKEPREFEKDCIWSATGEALGNYADEPETETTFLVEPKEQTFSDLKHLIFARYEAEEY